MGESFLRVCGAVGIFAPGGNRKQNSGNVSGERVSPSIRDGRRDSGGANLFCRAAEFDSWIRAGAVHRMGGAGEWNCDYTAGVAVGGSAKQYRPESGDADVGCVGKKRNLGDAAGGLGGVRQRGD